MAWFIKIDNKQDLTHLQNYISAWNVKCKDNISAYVEYADMFTRLDAAFQSPVEALEVSVLKEMGPEVKAVTTTRKVKKLPVVKQNLCLNHPMYKALRAPRTECEGCWAAFERLEGKGRADQARAKFNRNRKKELESKSQ